MIPPHHSVRFITPMHRVALACGLGLAAASAWAQPVVQQIPKLPGGTWIFVSNLSQDGRVVVADAEVAGGSNRAVRWTEQTGTQSLNAAPGHSYSSAYSVSGDGLTVVGVSGATYDIAARWTAVTGMVSLGSLAPGQPSFAFDASSNGSVIVGDGYGVGGVQRAWKWTSATGMQALPTLAPGTSHSLALDTNGSGSHIIGYCYNNAPALIFPVGCMWLPNGTILTMGLLPGTEMCVPSSMTDDGSVAFGYSATSTYSLTLPFRWTAATGDMQQLPLLAGTTGGTAGACTSDGSIVTGYCFDAANNATGTIWRTGQPAQSIAGYLASLGVATTGWTFTGAAVSPTGSAIAGNGTYQGVNAAWYVYLGADCTAAPSVISQPQPQTVAEGSGVTFTFGTSGGAITYQWLKGSAPIDGAVGATYSISPVAQTDGGLYSCVATNGCGSTTSSGALLTVTTDCPLPTILQQPVDAQSCAGAPIALVVEAIGGDPVEFQWLHNGDDAPNGQSSILVIANPTAAEAGAYVCRVLNDCGERLTDEVQVVVLDQCCDSIDFNSDTLFPDTQDIDDFLTVFSGGACSSGACGDIDFNNDGLFPDTLDIDSLLSVFSGGACI